MVKAATDSLKRSYTADQLNQGVYVGSDLCLACHKSMAGYKTTNHSSFIRRPLPQYTLVAGKGVLANSLKGTKDDFIAGLDFNTLTGTPFDKYKPNAPKLSVENGTYYLTVGSIKAPVIATLGGQRPNSFLPSGSAQRYLVRIPVADGMGGLSASVYVAPFTYTPGVGYAAFTTGWYDAKTDAPKLISGVSSAAVSSAGLSNHTVSCLGCHTNAPGSITKTAAGEYQFKGFVDISQASDDPTLLDYDNDGNFDVVNIGCEACHGAGSNHVLSGGDPALIVDPAKLSLAGQADICGRCHANGKSAPSGTFGWPYNEASGTTFTPFDARAGKPLVRLLQLQFRTCGPTASTSMGDDRSTRITRLLIRGRSAAADATTHMPKAKAACCGKVSKRPTLSSPRRWTTTRFASVVTPREARLPLLRSGMSSIAPGMTLRLRTRLGGRSKPIRIIPMPPSGRWACRDAPVAIWLRVTALTSSPRQ